MTRRICTVSALLISTMAAAQSLVRFEISELPSYHDTTSHIYITGSFNGWNPGNNQYRFTRDGRGKYVLDLKLAEGSYEYKLTRGSWNLGECNKGGSASRNRVLIVKNAQHTEQLKVMGWADNFAAAAPRHTASERVLIMDTAFAMPQLKDSRRIWIYLPRDYHTEPARRYPVLYMHDGQNLFDDATSYAGEWGIDEFLDTTSLPPCIVVGIDNGPRRMNEYNPYNTKRFGKGDGDDYVDFIVYQLKPAIDARYRTMSDQRQTMVAGSSMGGLISFYALLKYPNVFGGAGVFSPSFWIAPSLDTKVKETGKKLRSKLYFYAGTEESRTMVSDMKKIDSLLQSRSAAQTVVVVKDGAKHNEAAWRSVFPDFYKWMMNQWNNDPPIR